MNSLCVCDEHENHSLQELKPQFMRESNSVTGLIRHPESISGFVWDPKETIYWKLEKDSDTIPGIKNEEALIKKMNLTWTIGTKLKIKHRRRNTGDAQIIINVIDEPIFKKRPGVVAFAYGPSPGIGSDITFNPNILWSIDGKPISSDEYFKLTGKRLANPDSKARTYNFQHTGAHEMGHALGMPHSPGCKTCLMFPFYNNIVVPNPLDIVGIQRLYPKRQLPFWLWQKLIAKIGRGIYR